MFQAQGCLHQELKDDERPRLIIWLWDSICRGLEAGQCQEGKEGTVASWKILGQRQQRTAGEAGGSQTLQKLGATLMSLD